MLEILEVNNFEALICQDFQRGQRASLSMICEKVEFRPQVTEFNLLGEMGSSKC